MVRLLLSRRRETRALSTEEEMETESSALVATRFRTQENLHPAQWAAQVVLGYRAFRRLIRVGSAAAEYTRPPPSLPPSRASHSPQLSG
jgi:hypothetical protein